MAIQYLKKSPKTSSTDDSKTREIVENILKDIEKTKEEGCKELSKKFDKFEGDVVVSKEKIEDIKKKYKDEKNVPRPPHWSGWCLRPSSIEFWLHRDNRIHERLRYNKTTNGWEKEILYP